MANIRLILSTILIQTDLVNFYVALKDNRNILETQTRKVSFFQGKRDPPESHVDQMKVKIDSALGKEMITRRFATVEPVFGIRSFTSFSP